MKILTALVAIMLAFIVIDIELLVYGYAASYVWSSLIATKFTSLPTLDWTFFAGVMLLINVFTMPDMKDRSWEEIVKSTLTRMCVAAIACIMAFLIK